MALLKTKFAQPVGVVLFAPPSWRQGYYWMPGMTEAGFFDNPKQLANDTVWLTNANFEVTRNYANYVKHYRFLRIPLHRLLSELGLANKNLDEQAKGLFPFVERLQNVMESPHLYHSESLIAAMAQTLPQQVIPDITWQQLGAEAKSWYWKGSIKHKLLMGGSLYSPRFDYARQLIKCPVPDFSKAPKIIKGDFKGLVLQNLLKDHVGFARVRIEKVSREIAEFVDLNRTLITTTEALWLMQHAEVTAKYLYLTTSRPHPGDNPELLTENFKPFSWLDGIRLESLVLAPAYKNVAMEAYIRGLAHISMAHYALYLTAQKGLAPIALSYGKLGVAFNRNEEPNIRKIARESGLFFMSAEEEGVDLTIGQGL